MVAAADEAERLGAAVSLLPCSRLSSLLSSQPRLFAGDTIAASGRLVRDLDALPPAAAARVRVLLLGHCPLVSLRGVSQFPALERLSLVGCASLRDWDELRALAACPNLAHVALSGSGLSEAPFYRARALCALGAQSPLLSFDGVRTDGAELTAARRALRVRDAALVGLVAGEWRAWGLALVTRTQSVAAQLASRHETSPAYIAPRRPDIARLLAEWDARLPRRALPGELQPPLIALLEGELEWKAAAFAGPPIGVNPKAPPAAGAKKLTATAHHALALTIPPLPPALRADALRWASALAALAAVQASVLGELFLLAAAAADATLASRERAALRDPGGRVKAALEDAEAERAERCERDTLRTLTVAVSVPAVAGPGPGLLAQPLALAAKNTNPNLINNNRATATLNARAARRSRPPETEEDSGSVSCASTAHSEVLMAEAVARVAARGGLALGGGGGGEAGAAGLRASNMSEVSHAAVSHAAVSHAAVAHSSAVSAFAPSFAPPERDVDAEAAMGRLVAAVSRRGGGGAVSAGTPLLVPAPPPPPPPRRTFSIPSHHRTPFLDAADASDADAAAALIDARIATELLTLDAPALRLLAAGLAAKLRRFAFANARNAALAAERLTAADLELYEMNERVTVAEAQAERAERTAAVALAAAEAAHVAAAEATAKTDTEAGELRVQLAVLLARLKS